MHNREASEHARERRRQKAERRRRREVLDSKGKDKDKDKDGSGAPRYNRSQTQPHELAFFYPVPLWIGFGSCVTVPFVVNNPCATVSVLFPSFLFPFPMWRGSLTSLACASRAQWEVVWQQVRDRCVQAGVGVDAGAGADVVVVGDAGAGADAGADAGVDVVGVVAAAEADSPSCHHASWPDMNI